MSTSAPLPPHPPRLAERLVERVIGRLLGVDAGEVIAGDLAQEFHDRLRAGDALAATRRRYWRHAFASIRAAQHARGTQDIVMTETRSVSRFRRWTTGLSLDVRAVIRTLGRSPGYAAVAIVSLAIGIGANTAIVSVMRQLLLAPLPIERPDELKLVYWQPPTTKFVTRNLNSAGYLAPSGVNYRSNYTYPEFAAMREAVGGDTPFAGYNLLRRLMITSGTRPPTLSSGMIVTGAYFEVVRPPVARGRALTPDDDRAGAPLVAVVSDKFWQTYLSGSPSVVGSTVLIGDTQAQIVGVTAPGFRGLSPGGFDLDADVTVPMVAQPVVAPEWTDPPDRSLFADPEQHWIRAIARVPAARERSVTDRLTAAFRSAAVSTRLTPPQIAEAAPVLLPAPRGTDSLRTASITPLKLLSGVVSIVLFIACLNVAGLMLARGVSRQREMAVRRALGAGRWRLVRELLLESVLLSLAGGVAGMALALWGAPVLQEMLTAGLGTRGVTVAPDWHLLATTLAMATATGVAAGLIPALRLSRARSLAVNTRGQSSAPKLVVGRVLLALQIAISLPLVAGAGLFLQTLRNLNAVDLGFNPQQLVLFDVDPTMNGRSPERGAAIYPRLLQRLEEMPGVVTATYIENALISGWTSDSTVYTDNGEKVDLFMNRVGPHYLETMGIPLIEGRGIDARDRADGPLVCVINQTGARIFFGHESPIGRQIKNGARRIEVVGVFPDVKYQALKQAVVPTILQPYTQAATVTQHVVVKTVLPPAEFRRLLPDVLRDVDPNLPFTNFKTQVEQIDQTIGKERVFSKLLTVFGGFALLLACIGLHGVTSYAVTRRTNEIGIRIALGAQRRQVLWMILQQVLMLAGIGLLIGAPAAWAVGPTVQAMLYGLAPRDPATIAGAATVMVIVAVLAGYLPARRAARMEALTALRTE